MTTPRRLTFALHPLVWVDRFDGTRTPGIGLYRGRTVIAHVTYAEARQAADELHDIADLEQSKETP